MCCGRVTSAGGNNFEGLGATHYLLKARITKWPTYKSFNPQGYRVVKFSAEYDWFLRGSLAIPFIVPAFLTCESMLGDGKNRYIGKATASFYMLKG